MKEKMLTSNVVKLVYDVIAERSVNAVDTDCMFMSGIEFTITDRLSEDHASYVLNTYNNVAIYKMGKIQCIAIFPKSPNLRYNNI